MHSSNRNSVVVTGDGRRAYAALLEHSVQWRAYVQNLPGTSPHGPWLLEDLFYALHESALELNPRVSAELHRNFAVVAALLPMAAFQRLRQQTVGDAVTAALAVRRLADDLLMDEGDGDGNVRRNALTRMRSLAAWAGSRRKRSAQRSASSEHDGAGARSDGRPDYRAMKALDAAAVAVERDRQVRGVWGIEPGIRSVHVLDDVWLLVDAVRALPGFEALTEAFDEMRELMHPAVRGRRRGRRSVQPGFERLDGLTRGRDIERVVPEELVRLLDEDLVGLFHEAHEHGRLLQERYGGKQPETPGPLVCCLDVSRSMNTIAAQGRERFVWAKGIGLALLDTARRAERPYLGICFSSESDLATFEVPVGGYRPAIAIDMARCDFDGGTHFRAPFTKAVEYLQRQRRESGRRDGHELEIGGQGQGSRSGSESERRPEHGGSEHEAGYGSGTGYVRGYGNGRGLIVFVTDGEAALPEHFVDQFARARETLGFRLITVFIDGQQPELVSMSDAVFSVNADRVESWERTTYGLARAIVSGM